MRTKDLKVTVVFCVSESEREFNLEVCWYANEDAKAGAERTDPAAD